MTDIQARDHSGHAVTIQKTTTGTQDKYFLGTEELVAVERNNDIVLRNRNGKEFVVSTELK